MLRAEGCDKRTLIVQQHNTASGIEDEPPALAVDCDVYRVTGRLLVCGVGYPKDDRFEPCASPLLYGAANDSYFSGLTVPEDAIGAVLREAGRRGSRQRFNNAD